MRRPFRRSLLRGSGKADEELRAVMTDGVRRETIVSVVALGSRDAANYAGIRTISPGEMVGF